MRRFIILTLVSGQILTVDIFQIYWVENFPIYVPIITMKSETKSWNRVTYTNFTQPPSDACGETSWKFLVKPWRSFFLLLLLLWLEDIDFHFSYRVTLADVPAYLTVPPSVSQSVKSSQVKSVTAVTNSCLRTSRPPKTVRRTSFHSLIL